MGSAIKVCFNVLFRNHGQPRQQAPGSQEFRVARGKQTPEVQQDVLGKLLCGEVMTWVRGGVGDLRTGLSKLAWRAGRGRQDNQHGNARKHGNRVLSQDSHLHILNFAIVDRTATGGAISFIVLIPSGPG